MNINIAALFGGEAEREEFERSARHRADEPQTAPLLTLTTATPTTVTITICMGC
jgi:hypothetical protein